MEHMSKINKDRMQSGEKTVIIGEVLEQAVLGASVKPVEKSDAAAIQSAAATPIGAAAQSAADRNPQSPLVCFSKTTLDEVLKVHMLEYY